MPNRKRLFIGLVLASLALIALLIGGIWYLFNHQDRAIYHIITTVFLGMFVGLFALAAIGTGVMIISIIRAQNIPSLEGTIRVATNFLFPLVLGMGGLVGIARERILGSYIEVNNFLVRIQKTWAARAGKIMILVPHCLQDSKCPFKVTMDVDNCRRCGKCDISNLIEIAERYGAILKVATGGTLARKYIKEVKPRGVVAIACERDLSLGIQDSNPLPVMGVLNRRPFGPCQDTEVDLDKVEEAILVIRGG